MRKPRSPSQQRRRDRRYEELTGDAIPEEPHDGNVPWEEGPQPMTAREYLERYSEDTIRQKAWGATPASVAAEVFRARDSGVDLGSADLWDELTIWRGIARFDEVSR